MTVVRVDIQALRGVAILLVLFYHTDVGPFQAGYLGVDIFFVISGFLITGIIKRAIEDGRFRFGDFYYRRAKRLLPAAYVTFFLTAIAAPFVLDAAALADFGFQLQGAVTFTANITPWIETGAMQGDPKLKPLVHAWSLAVEEQYYLLLPAFLLFVRKSWVLGTFAILLISLGLFALLVEIEPMIGYMVLPTRAWQLAIGSLLALTLWDSHTYRPWVGLIAFYLGSATLLFVPSFSPSTIHPVTGAILVSLAAAMVIWSSRSLSENNLALRLLAGVGNISYSLYLLHVPLIVFLNNLTRGKPALELRLLAAVAALLSAYLLYRYVEKPIHRKHFSPTKKRRFITSMVIVSVLLLALPLAYKTA